MNMKALAFAGLGLFISMVATTMWISSDLTEIKEKRAAKERLECAQKQAANASLSAATSASDATGTAQGTPPASDSEGADCPPPAAGANAQASSQAAAGATTDPVTGQPTAPTDLTTEGATLNGAPASTPGVPAATGVPAGGAGASM